MTYKTYSFEKMLAWIKAKELAVFIYPATQNFPIDEKFGMVSQIKRAATSVVHNLAEGSARITNKEKARFYEMAYGSNIEVLSETIVAYELKWLNDDQYCFIRNKVDEVSFLIAKMRKTLLNDESPKD